MVVFITRKVMDLFVIKWKGGRGHPLEKAKGVIYWDKGQTRKKNLPVKFC